MKHLPESLLSRFLPCRLAACALLGSFALRAAGAEFYFLNPTSEESAIPARIEASSLGLQDGSYVAEGIKGVVDVAGGQAMISAALAPMTSAKFAPGGAAAPMAIKEGDPIEIKTSACIYRIGTGHLEASSGPKSSRLALGKGFQPAVLQRGAGVVVVGSSEKGSSQRIEIFVSGLVRLSGFRGLSFDAPDGTRPVQSRKMELGVTKPAGGQALVFPEDWVRFEDGAKSLGLGIFPAYGSTVKAKDANVSVEGGEVWMAPAANDTEARRMRVRTQPPLALVRTGTDTFAGRLEAGGKSACLAITDRNKNGLPDTAGDLWLWSANPQAQPGMAFAFSQSPESGSGTRLAIFKTGGVDLAATLLDEDPVAHREAPAGQKLLKPELLLEDWNGDGLFLNGGVVFGGFPGNDRISKDGVEWAQCWDLNGDRFADVFEYSPGHYIFNFKQEIPSLIGLDLDPLTGGAAVRITKGYGMQEHASMFSKSCDPAGRLFKGAVQAFEEHFFADIKPGENPAMWKNGAAFFYYLIGGGDVNRLTMGRLDGSKTLRDWDIELDPVPDPADTAAQWNVTALRDPRGRELKLHTISVPPGWKGGKLDAKGYFQGWYDMVGGKYKTRALYACFAPPGTVSPSSEGMYGGALTTQERMEVDEHGGTFTLYYSPLMGGLHLKGADFGTYAIPAGTPDFFLDLNRYYHREAHTGEERFVGTQPATRWRQREAKRLEGPVFLSYSDADGDGFFDRYIYDIDNDGIYERSLTYRASSSILTLADRTFCAAWPQAVDFEEVKFLPENYDRVSDLYRKGTGQPPLVASTQLGSSGIPVNLLTQPVFRESTPSFFATFGPEWRTVVAADGYHGSGRDPWKDFGPSGLSRIGTMFVQRGMVQETLGAPWTDESLSGVDVLVLSSPGLTPSSEEIAALKRWIERGGICILSVACDEPSRIRFAAIGRELGFEPTVELLDKRAPIYMWKGLGGIGSHAKASELRTPAPWNRIEKFAAPPAAGLLDGFGYLSFAGYPLARMDSPLKPLLEYEGMPLMALGGIGKGRLLVSGVDLWTNRFIWHHEFFEGGTQNDRLVERLVGFAATPDSILEVKKIECAPEKIRIELSGKGGPLRFSRRYEPWSTDLAKIGNRADVAKKRLRPAGATVNGQPAELREDGVLMRVSVPAGPATLEVTFAEITE
jgi:hypothetical protein